MNIFKKVIIVTMAGTFGIVSGLYAVAWYFYLTQMVGAVLIAVALIGFVAFKATAKSTQSRSMRVKMSISQLESAQGVPLPFEGTCRACDKPLVAGAVYCTYCGEHVLPPYRICSECAERNPGDARYCHACGKLVVLTIAAPSRARSALRRR